MRRNDARWCFVTAFVVVVIALNLNSMTMPAIQAYSSTNQGNVSTVEAEVNHTFHALNLKTIVLKGFRCDLSPFSGSYSAGRPVSLGTLVVFQSNTGSQLKHFVEHHSAVLGYRSIVIIDHQVIGREQDSFTDYLLHSFGASGADIWRCVGSFDHKPTIWSHVIKQYTNTSSFVFPLDVDEYLTVKTKGASSGSISRNDALVWNMNDFSRALLELNDTGMPYKTEKALIVPTDCGNMTWTSVDESLQEHGTSLTPSRYAFRSWDHKVDCMNKVFMRARDFRSTDIGNHRGMTHKFPSGVCNVAKQKSDILIVHAQQNNFEEWLLHGLRGAAVRGFNSFTNVRRECGGRSSHYCTFWRDIVEPSKLDPWALKKIYRESFCENWFRRSELIRIPISL